MTPINLPSTSNTVKQLNNSTENVVKKKTKNVSIFHQNCRVCARVAPQRRKGAPRNSLCPETCMSTCVVREE